MNAQQHRLGAFLAVAGVSAHLEAQKGAVSLKPLVNGLAASVMTSLPDRIEPPDHPNHRQFFHSLLFAAAVGYGVYQAYQWQPDDDWHKVLRWLAMIGGSAYLVHLAMDFTTRKSLPLVGKL